MLGKFKLLVSSYYAYVELTKLSVNQTLWTCKCISQGKYLLREKQHSVCLNFNMNVQLNV